MTIKSYFRKWFSLEGLACIVAICFAGFYLYVAIKRILYPYDLDFIEDNMLMQAIQISLGKPVYVPPNADFVPQVYMPLYTILGGWMFKVVPPSFIALRLFSFLASLLTAILIFWISRRVCGSRAIAFCAGALFLAGDHITGGWDELARVDALYVLLTLSGVALLLNGKENRFRLPLAGCILALAFLTKQNGLFFAFVVAVYLVLMIGWQTLNFVIPFLVVSFFPILYLDEVSRGWFATYAFKIAYLSPIDLHRVAGTLRDDLFGSMIGLTILLLAASASFIRCEGWKRFALEPWNWFIGAALFISIAGRASVGGNRNNLMPAYAFLSIAPALAARETRQWRDRWLVAAKNGLFILVILQFGLTSFIPKYPLGLIPTVSMKKEGDRLIHHIAMFHGPVLVLMHPYYARLAGKEPGVDIQMLWHARLRGQEPLPEDFVNRIRNHYYSAIISDESTFETQPDVHQLLTTYYTQTEILDLNESPPTMNGVIVQPKMIYEPRSP